MARFMIKESRFTMNLNENQLKVIRGYLDLLETIDEAFGYVKSRPLIDQVDAAEKMYPDILKGWTKLSETHGLIGSYFNERPYVSESIETFNQLIEAWEMEMPASFQREKLTYKMIKTLGPSYQKWKQGMAQELQKVAVH
jgi:hypothetical protein